MLILDNLAPLVGCRQDSKKWSPYVSYKVVNRLDIAKYICLNLDNDVYQKGLITYKFNNKLSQNMISVYHGVKDFDSEYINKEYLVQRIISGSISEKSLFLIGAHDRKLNDSAILQVLEEQKELEYCPYYNHLMFILLDIYCMRKDLYEYFIEGKDLLISEVRPSRLEQSIENIRYVKVKLEEWDIDSTINLNHHLSALMLNVQAIKRYISDQIIER